MTSARRSGKPPNGYGTTSRWDHAQRLRAARTDTGAIADDVHMAHDADGERVRKMYAHGLVEERVYLGEYELYRRRGTASGSVELERETLRLTDGHHVVALVETKTVDTAAPPSALATRRRYQAADHHGSVRLELDHTGAVLS